jgi:uncharacterized membrane protein HdeD (DUF308 family)
MASFLYHNRWLIAMRGVVALAFGVLAFVWPGATALALVFLFAAYALIDGVLTISAAVRNREVNERWWLGLLEGLVDIAAGVIAILFPGMTAVVAVFVVAIWAIITGILEIAAAVRLRQEISNEWALGLTGLVSVVLGVIMVINPGAGLLGLVWAIGSYAIIFGLLMIYLAASAGRYAPTGTAGPGARVYTK